MTNRGLPFVGSLNYCAIVLITLAPALSASAQTYTDGKLTVHWTRSGDDFTGTFMLGAGQFPATAHITGTSLSGSFTSGPNQFSFSGSLDSTALTLKTGGTTYTLKIQPDAANPLAPANPLAGANPPATGPSNAPPGYTVIISADYGCAVSANKDGVTTMQAALEAAFADLTNFFAAKPMIGSSYQDAKNPKVGGATFSSTWNGNPIKGIVSCQLTDKGATIAVVFAHAGTAKADWDKLMNPPQPAAAATAPPAPAIPLAQHDFPDGSGSMGLADGWTTQTQTLAHTVVITGPANQQVALSISRTVQTPDSPMVKMRQQQEQWLAQQRARYPAMARVPATPPPPMLVAAYTDPDTALQALFPQLNQMSLANKGPSVQLDQIVSSKDIPSHLPSADAKAAEIVYKVTQSQNGNSQDFRVWMHFEMSSYPGGTSWFWFVNTARAPDASFDADLPVMRAMMLSTKVNEDKLKQIFAAENAALAQESQALAQASQAESQALRQQAQDFSAQQNARYQAFRDQQQASFQAHNEQWAADETQKQRATADFIEQIQGTRTIYDTQTGTVSSASLYDVNGVVDSLNQAALDPNRFVQIPLRDQLYAPTPVPGQ
jgi:hypothetical protein